MATDILCDFTATPIPTNCCDEDGKSLNNSVYFTGMASDGCNLYFTSPQDCMVYIVSNDFCYVDCCKIARPYTSISYDTNKRNFLATIESVFNVIYILDCNFREIDCIKLFNCVQACTKIMGISYNCANDSIYVAYKNCIIEIDMHGNVINILSPESRGYATGVLSIAPYYILLIQSENDQIIAVFNPCNDMVECFSIPREYCIEDLLLDPCAADVCLDGLPRTETLHKRPPHDNDDPSCTGWNCKGPRLSLLAMKHGCYPWLIEFYLSNCLEGLEDCVTECICDTCGD